MPFDAPVWRLLSVAASSDPQCPAQAPEGRFHHAGQIAAYASLSAEGAEVAVKRYLNDGVPRVLVPMRLVCDRLADISAEPEASIIWQDIRATGAPSPTWTFSDKARRDGAEAMIYASRSRPDLQHVVVFEPSCLRFVGPVTPFVPKT